MKIRERCKRNGREKGEVKYIEKKERQENRGGKRIQKIREVEEWKSRM